MSRAFFKLQQKNVYIWRKASKQRLKETNKNCVCLTKREKRAQNYDLLIHRKHNRKSFCIYLRFSNFSFDSSFSLSFWDKDHVFGRISIRHVCSRYKHHVVGEFSCQGHRLMKIEFVNAFQFSFLCFCFWKMEKWI